MRSLTCCARRDGRDHGTPERVEFGFGRAPEERGERRPGRRSERARDHPDPDRPRARRRGIDQRAGELVVHRALGDVGERVLAIRRRAIRTAPARAARGSARRSRRRTRRSSAPASLTVRGANASADVPTSASTSAGIDWLALILATNGPRPGRAGSGTTARRARLHRINAAALTDFANAPAGSPASREAARLALRASRRGRVRLQVLLHGRREVIESRSTRRRTSRSTSVASGCGAPSACSIGAGSCSPARPNAGVARPVDLLIRVVDVGRRQPRPGVEPLGLDGSVGTDRAGQCGARAERVAANERDHRDRHQRARARTVDRSGRA